MMLRMVVWSFFVMTCTSTLGATRRYPDELQATEAAQAEGLLLRAEVSAVKKPKAMEESWPASKTELWALERIIPYPGNPRQHSPEQVDLIAGSMKDDGVTSPILVDEEGVIIYGHGRRLAAEKNAFAKYPVVVARGWSEEQKRAYRIKDNSYALLSTWSPELLRIELSELSLAGYEMPLLGFDDVQLVSFLSVPNGADPEATPEPPVKPISRVGDLWQLGKHRILCGDSTKTEDVERVLDGKKPHLMVTDPPYGVEYDANWRNEAGRTLNGGFQRLRSGKADKPIGARAIGKVENDDQSDWREAWSLFPGNVAYCWHAGRHASSVDLSFRSVGFEVRAQIIWNKGRMVIGRGDYHWAHEPCWYLVRKGATGAWSGDRKQTTMWDIEHRASETGHSTQKPIECMRRPIQNNSKPGNYVYEPFAGSGTTIIAAEMMNRYAIAIEINPAYVDVCIERWQTFAKAEAVLAGDGRTFAEITKARKGGKDATRNPRVAVSRQHANGNGTKQAVRAGGDARQPAAKRKPTRESPLVAGDS
jgi:DNA modification methylase